MLEHWIQQNQGPSFQKEYLSEDRLGSHLISSPGQQPQTGAREVALIGADGRWAKLVRRHLYQFAHRMSETRIYDLGDLRRTDPDFVIGPFIELLSSKITPIVVGANTGMIKALRLAYQHLSKPFHPAVLHETIPDSLINSTDWSAVIGVQQHLIPRQAPSHIHPMHLSAVRNSTLEAESMIRESNALIFDLTAMSMVDLPAQKGLSSSGFCTEEACTLMRYAGLHADTGVVICSGHDPMSLQLDMSANTTAQLIWYFLEAFNQCIVEDPMRSTHCTTYTVHLDAYDTNFVFYKSERTGRWWVQLRSEQGDSMLPCTFRDYQFATNGQVSDRLIACANNSLERSKQSF